MTDLEKIREWIRGFPGFDILSEFQVDYTDRVPANGGIFPSGLQEVGRKEYIYGDVLVTNQLNFGIYYVFEKAPGDDIGAAVNADWLMDFQKWVQEQSIRAVEINVLRADIVSPVDFFLRGRLSVFAETQRNIVGQRRAFGFAYG